MGNSPGAAIDYDALAQQYGGSPAAIDYDALAATRGNAAQLLSDFSALPAAEQQKVLATLPEGHILKDFAALPSSEQQKVLGGFSTPANAGTAQHPLVTPLPGESFADTMARAERLGRQTTPGASQITGISAQPKPEGIGDRISTWAQNVANDMKYGTDVTGIGTVLKKLGAHGVYNGNSEAIGDYMAGLPLGILRVTQGEGEVASGLGNANAGKLRQGAKDIGAGMLQQLSSPEGGLASEAVSTFSGASKAATASKVAANTDEWQRINGILKVGQKAIRIGPDAASLEQAATMPGRALANAGFTADQLSKMSPLERTQAITPLWREAGREVGDTVRKATDAGTTLDVGKTVNQTLKKMADPILQQRAMESFNALTRELGIVDQRIATPEEALALRQALQSGARFGMNGDLSSLGGVRAQLYRSVSGDLKDAVPGLAKLDQNYSDLKAAVDAAMTGVRKMAASAPPPSTASRILDYAKTTALPWAARGALGYGGYRGLRSIADLLGGGNEP